MARQKYPSDEIDKTMVRFPPGLMGRVKDAAARNGRSMNAEIISTLEREYPEPASIPVMVDYIKMLADLYEKQGFKNAHVLREIYDTIDGIRSAMEAEEDTPSTGEK